MAKSCPGELVLSDLRLEKVSVGTLAEVNLAVAGGQVICLSGSSGSGKSRLLRAVADLEAHGGRITLDGTEQRTLPAHQWRRRVVMVPSDSQWWFDDVGSHFPHDAVTQLPAALGFPADVMGWSVSRLSSGERQRLALWRALILRPDALLLDEPTANLDGEMTGAVETWLLEEIRQRKIGTLWVAHDKAQIHRVADQHYRVHGTVLEHVDGSH